MRSAIERILTLTSVQRQCFVMAATAFFCCLEASTVRGATSGDQEFFEELRRTCIETPLILGTPLFELCANGFPQGVAWQAFNLGSFSTNVSNAGGQGANSQRSATQQRKCVAARENCRDEVEARGGGASADFEFGSIGLSLAAQSGKMKRTASVLENGYSGDLSGGLIGLDLRPEDTVVLGLAYSKSKSEAIFDAKAGDSKTDSALLNLHLTLAVGDAGFLSGYVGRGDFDTTGSRAAIFGNVRAPCAQQPRARIKLLALRAVMTGILATGSLVRSPKFQS